MKKSLTSKGIFPAKWAWTLLIPIRNIFLSPKKILKRLHLKDNAKVLELGCGPGYFTIPIAKAIPNGNLVAADIQQEMLTKVKKRIQKAKIKNVSTHLCDGRILPFEDSCFDCIFLITVLGEIENKDSYIKEFYRVIKNEGIVSISEQWGDAENMDKTDIVRLFKRYNFSLIQNFGGNKTFTLNFKK